MVHREAVNNPCVIGHKHFKDTTRAKVQRKQRK